VGGGGGLSRLRLRLLSCVWFWELGVVCLERTDIMGAWAQSLKRIGSVY
jgi:hypothetical protein